jgi:hypothetical protein
MDFPTYENPTAHHAQAVLDNTDLKALSVAPSLTGVISGCLVSANTTMGAAVASGSIIIGGTTYTTAGGTVTVSAASVGDRRDIVYATWSGSAVVFTTAAGTPATAGWTFGTQGTPPIKPTLPDSAVLLAEIYVVGSGATPTTVVTSGEIVDKRCFVTLDATKIPLSTVTNNGDLIVGSGSGTVGRLGLGTANQVLTVASGATGLTYTTPTALAAGAQQDLYIKQAARTVSATITNNEVALFDTTSGPLTCTLPTAASRGQISVVLIAGSNPLTIQAGTGQTINGSLSSITLTAAGQSVRLASYATNNTYIILANSSIPAGATGFAAGGDLTGYHPNPTLISVGTSGTYGGLSGVPAITTDANGRVTLALPTALPPYALSTNSSGNPLFTATAGYSFTTTTYTSTSLTITLGSTPSSAASTATTMTYTVAAGHALQAGQVCVAAGFTTAGYNGTFVVSAITATTVTVLSTNNPASLASNANGKIYPYVAVGQSVYVTVSSPASGWTNGSYQVTAVSGNTVTVAASNTLASAPTAGVIYISYVTAGPNGGVAGQTATWTSAGLLYVNSSTAGKNALPNSAADFWSRGTSFTVVPGTPQWTADRFYVTCLNGTNVGVAQNTTATLPLNTNYALRLTPTTGGASWTVQTALETANVLPLQGLQLSLGYYNRSNNTANRFMARVFYSTVSDSMAQGTWQDLGVYSSAGSPTTTFSTATVAPVSLTFTVPSSAVGLMFQWSAATVVSSVVVNASNTSFTITTATAHNLSVGDTINLLAVTNTGFDATWTCAAGTTGTTIVVTPGVMPSGSSANLTCTLHTNPSVTMRHTASSTFDLTKLQLEWNGFYQTTAMRQSGLSSTALEMFSNGAVADSVLVTNNAPDAAAGSGTPTWLPIGASGTVLASNGSTSVFSPLPNSAGKNYFINGALDFWQRGTSFSSGANAYTADRWYAWGGFGTAGAYTVSQQTGIGLTGFQNSIRMQRTNGSSNTTNPFMGQSFETAVFLPLAGQTITYSFYARAGANFSAAGGVMNAAVATGTGTDQQIGNSYTGTVAASNVSAALTTSWQRFTGTVTLGTTATEMALQFSYLPVGTAGANDWFEVTGVQVELGSVTTNFTRAGGHIADELKLCQRYAQLMPHSTLGFAVNATTITFFTTFPQVMRTAPSPVFITTSVNVDNGLSNTTSSGSTMSGSSAYTTSGARAFMTGFSGLTTGAYWALATFPAVLFSAEM